MKTKLLVPALLLTLTTNLFAQSAVEQIEGSINNINSLVDTLTDSIERAELPEDGITLTQYPLVKDAFIRQARAKTDAYKTCLVEIKNEAVNSIQGYETEIQRLRNTLQSTDSSGLRTLLSERENARDDLLERLKERLTQKYQSCQMQLAGGLIVKIRANKAPRRRLGVVLSAPTILGIPVVSMMLAIHTGYNDNFTVVNTFGDSLQTRAGRLRSDARETMHELNAGLFSECRSELPCYYLVTDDWKSWYSSLRSLMVDIRLSSDVKLKSRSMMRDRKIKRAIESSRDYVTESLRSNI